MAKRQGVESNELMRRAFKYIARNTTLPQKVRHQAQLQLNQFPLKTRPAAVSNRCIETGRGRGIMSEFGLCRVRCYCDLYRLVYATNSVRFFPLRFSLRFSLQYQFRLKAMKGGLPGVEKATW